MGIVQENMSRQTKRGQGLALQRGWKNFWVSSIKEDSKDEKSCQII